MTVSMPDHATDIYKQEEVAKFMATASREGEVNVALIISQIPADDGKMAFGEWMMVKTKKNLAENPRFASFAITQKLEMAGFKGEVEEWVKTGPCVEKINSLNIIRYNAYMGIHNVAIASIQTMIPLKPRVSYQTFLADFIALRTLGRLGGNHDAHGVETPKQVMQKFNGMMSIKVLAYNDGDGYPGIMPVLSTRFRAPDLLSFKISSYNRALEEIEVPGKVALSVMTMDMKTFQLKGELIEVRKMMGVRTGLVRMDEVYSSMPPFIGERLA